MDINEINQQGVRAKEQNRVDKDLKNNKQIFPL
jgi:hypothetical protein